MHSGQAQLFSSIRIFLFICFQIIFVGVSMEAFAVVEVSEVLRREIERNREMQRDFHTSKSMFQKKSDLRVSRDLPKETPCFQIHRIEIKTDERKFGWLDREANRFSHQCIGIHGLEKLLAILNSTLVHRGYLTSRVTLTPQNLSSGVLILTLRVGRIEKIQMVKKTKPPSTRKKDIHWGTWRNAFPAKQGDILNIRHIEQGLERMKRLPSQKVAIQIEPGSQPNTSFLYIERTPICFVDRFHGGLTLDNSGSASLSHEQFSGYFSYDNPLGLNDLLNFNFSTNARNPAPDHRGQSATVNYAIPFGYSLLTLGQSHTRFSQMVQGHYAALLSSGQSNTSEIRFNQTLARTSKSLFGAFVGTAHNRAHSFLNGEEVEVQRRRVTNAEVGFTGERLMGDSSSMDFSSGIRRGVTWGGVQKDFPAVNFTGEGLPFERRLTARPTIVTYTFHYNHLFSLGTTPLQYAFYLHGQYTRNTTLSVDQIAIGSRYTVRGFDGNRILMSENGYFIRNDFALRLPSILKASTYFLYWGIDYGRVWGPSSSAQAGHHLAGTAVGIRSHLKGFLLDIALGTPLYKPEGFQTHRINPYLSLTYQF